jgi:DNA modification methylase
VKDGGKPSSLWVYHVVVRKLTYKENDLKGEMVNIYQKPQALINYLIDTFSNEGDWFLDLFSGSGKNYDLTFLIYVFLQCLT